MPTRAPHEETLAAALRSAARNPHAGLGILDARGRTQGLRSYEELLADATLTGSRLHARGVEPHTRVGVCLPTSAAFFDTWLGAVLAGAWPIALAPPGGIGTAESQLRRIDSLVRRLELELVVGSATLREQASRLDLSRLAAAATSFEELSATPPAPRFEIQDAFPEDVAYLQLTSGSTGLPRAAMVRHGAALHNAAAIDEAIAGEGGRRASQLGATGVSWLPLHHDMGLVGIFLVALRFGLSQWHMPPRAFLGRPLVWLRHLADHAVTAASAPCFAYEVCVERSTAEQRAALDLSGYRAAMVGAEMIRPDTIARFCEAFAPAGFAREAIRACYGMAEATLAVTFDSKHAGLRTRPAPGGAAEAFGLREVACVGAPVRDTALRIVGPNGAPLPEGRVGEIEVSGPGVVSGYLGDPEATEANLRDGWLRTGDLGFVVDGELYVTGRVKDLIILGGQNVSPYEIEWVAESIAGAGGSRRAGVFSVPGPHGERAVLVLEVEAGSEEALERLERDLRVGVGRHLGSPVADVVLVRRGAIPRTTSGKVRRAELQRLYTSKELARLR